MKALFDTEYDDTGDDSKHLTDLRDAADSQTRLNKEFFAEEANRERWARGLSNSAEFTLIYTRKTRLSKGTSKEMGRQMVDTIKTVAMILLGEDHLNLADRGEDGSHFGQFCTAPAARRENF